MFIPHTALHTGMDPRQTNSQTRLFSLSFAMFHFEIVCLGLTNILPGLTNLSAIWSKREISFPDNVALILSPNYVTQMTTTYPTKLLQLCLYSKAKMTRKIPDKIPRILLGFALLKY